MEDSEYAKEAGRLVALDRQLAGATRAALRSWARTRKATTRTYGALRFAAALDEQLAKTHVTRAEQRSARKP